MRPSSRRASEPDDLWAVLARSVIGGSLSLVVFLGLAVALVTSARRIAGPPGWTLAELASWFDRQPVGAAFRALAAMGLIVVAYLIVSTVAVLSARVARALRLPGVGRFAEVIAIPVVRRALAALLGLGITVANTTSAHASAPPAAIAPMTHASEPTPGVPVATMHSLSPPATPESNPESTWTIRAGDHLWGLAAAALAERGSRAPTDGEIQAYLKLVIEQNRDRLAVADHPDLVFPGQVFVRPTLPVR